VIDSQSQGGDHVKNWDLEGADWLGDEGGVICQTERENMRSGSCFRLLEVAQGSFVRDGISAMLVKNESGIEPEFFLFFSSLFHQRLLVRFDSKTWKPLQPKKIWGISRGSALS